MPGGLATRPPWNSRVTAVCQTLYSVEHTRARAVAGVQFDHIERTAWAALGPTY